MVKTGLFNVWIRFDDVSILLTRDNLGSGLRAADSMHIDVLRLKSFRDFITYECTHTFTQI